MKYVKKTAAFLLAFALISAFAACGDPSAPTEDAQAAVDPVESVADARAAEAVEADSAETNSTEAGSTQAEVPEDAQGGDTAADAGSDILVVYFSRTGEQYTVGVIDEGNTAIVAGMIAEQTGADTFEILPEEDYYPYTYDELTEVAKQEQNENARPAYQGPAPDLSRYDTVFLGAPVWWGDWPMIMYTFFEENAEALSGKTLVPFSTHEGSGLSGFDRKLSAVIPGADVAEGLAVRGNDAQNQQESVRGSVESWLSGLGY